MHCAGRVGRITPFVPGKMDCSSGISKTPDSFQAALDGMSKEDVNQRWQDFMAPYFEGLDGAHADELMIELEEVFHMD